PICGSNMPCASMSRRTGKALCSCAARGCATRFSSPVSSDPMTGSLFDDAAVPPALTPDAPLAERLRPKTLDEIVGLEDLLGEGRFLRNAIASDRIPSVILWGC